MKLKPVKKVAAKVQKEEATKTRKDTKKQENTLPPDEYRPMFPPVRVLVRETESRKTGTPIKQYLELSVKRFDDDESPVCLWIQMYQESDFYTGYLKGKTVYLPLDQFDTLIDGLQDLFDEVETRGIV